MANFISPDLLVFVFSTPTAETFKKFSSSFMTCPELIQVQLPEVDIHGRKYTDADQKNVIKIIQEYLNYNSNGDYCGKPGVSRDQILDF